MKQSVARIGRVKPKLDVLRNDNVALLSDNFERVEDVIANMIEYSRRNDVRAYAIVTVDAEGRVDRNAIIRPDGATHALIGGLFAMAHDLAASLDDG